MVFSSFKQKFCRLADGRHVSHSEDGCKQAYGVVCGVGRMQSGCVETGTLILGLTLAGPVTPYNSSNLSQGHPLILFSLLVGG